ncbi:unnamed protein product [Brugia pahangi]|uniref:Centrosomal protein POC5 n=1 Tax=Brugia pahangi TaxID=6280 RepID=A0A0N4TNU0_BRUPA|nr:unnamed protein product [Brugia pahangi]
MSSFSNRNVRTVHSVSRSQPPEIPRRWNNPEDLREQNVPEDTEIQSTKVKHIRQQMMEYRTLLKCQQSLRLAENMRHRTKQRAMREKCKRYKQEITDTKKLNATFQESFYQLEQQLIHCTQQLFHLEAENERERRNTSLKPEKNCKEKSYVNFTTKNVLHAKRIAERKLRELMEKYEVEVTRSTEQTNNMEILKSTVQQLKLKLEEKERLCNDSKRCLTIHSRATSLAYRQIQETNNRAVKLLKESEKLHSQFVDVHSELIDIQEVHNIIEAEMNQVKWQNTKHCEKAKIAKKDLEEAFDSTKAVLLSQHQELKVYETNWKIQKQKISLIKLQ